MFLKLKIILQTLHTGQVLNVEIQQKAILSIRALN